MVLLSRRFGSSRKSNPVGPLRGYTVGDEKPALRGNYVGNPSLDPTLGSDLQPLGFRPQS